LAGIHTNMPAMIPDDIAKALGSGGPPRELPVDALNSDCGHERTRHVTRSSLQLP
jgi:hypothetical protein